MKKIEVSKVDYRGHGNVYYTIFKIWAEIRNGHIYLVGSENGREGGVWWRKSWGDRNDRNYLDIAREFYDYELLTELREKAYNDVDKLPTLEEMKKIIVKKETERILDEIKYHSTEIEELNKELKNLKNI